MADSPETIEAPPEVGAEPLPPVSGGYAESEIAVAPVGNHAGDSVPSYAGLRGGRQRVDGLIPGSKEAREMDKLVDRIRYWRKKNPGKVHPEQHKCPGRFGNPPAATISAGPSIPAPAPLPSAVPGNAPVSFETPAPEIDPLDTLAGDAQSALELWTGTDLEDVLRELVELVEEWRQTVRDRKARKALLPESVVKELAAASRWNDRLKNRVAISGSRVCAKLLNSSGVSATWKDEIILASAAIGLALSEVKANSAFDKLIVAARNGPPVTVEPKNKPVEVKG
jgi:hypothetical protein